MMKNNIKITLGLLLVLLQLLAFGTTAALKVFQGDSKNSISQIEAVNPDEQPICLQKQTCDQIGCQYGLERYFRGQDSMRSFIPGAKFKDEFFPSSSSSLYWENFVKDQNDAMTVFSTKVKSWARPTDMYPRRAPSLWGEKGVQPSGLRQGMLGDCWILGAAAALAEHPERLKKIFTQQEYDQEGIFELNFWHKGADHKVIVDDRLPMYKTPSTPISFQMNDNGGWWATILEKAYAKMNQNYVRLSGGLSFASLRALTGMPVIPHFPMYFPNKYDELTLWQILSEGEKRSHVMCGDVFTNEHGLVAGHTYTILGVSEVTSEGKSTRLVKLRSPWSTDKYTGPWANSDSLWTSTAKNQTGIQKNGDVGVFHMPITLFKKMFGTFSVGMYQSTWLLSQTVFQPLQDTQKTLATKIRNPGNQEVAITIDGMPARMLPETCAPPWPKNIPGQIALIGANQHIIEKQIIFPHSNYGWIHVKNLPAGEYVVYVQFSGKGPVQGLKNVSLSAYGLQACVEINNAPCALIQSGQKNSATDFQDGILQDPLPVRDPTEKMRSVPSPLKSTKQSGVKSTAGTSGINNQTGTTKAGTNTTNKSSAKDGEGSGVMPGTPNMPMSLNTSMESAEEADDRIVTPDQFKIDDKTFEWSSRAKILKESLDQLVEALRAVDKKYQQLTKWDSELQSQKVRIESRKLKVQQEYEQLLAKLRAASQSADSYNRYANVLDVASNTVGQITHGLQGLKLTQVDVQIPTDPSFIQTEAPPYNELLQMQSEFNTFNPDVEYLEFLTDAVNNLEPLVVPKDLKI